MTQSVGVPFTAKCRSEILRRRNGSLRVSEWATPDWSYSGATTKISSDRVLAMRSMRARPGAYMPSSLVIRMRIRADSSFRDCFDPAHIDAQCLRHGDGTVGVLIIFQNRDKRAANRDGRTIEPEDK